MIDMSKQIAPQLADIQLLTDEGVDIDKAWRPFMEKIGIPLNIKTF